MPVIEDDADDDSLEATAIKNATPLNANAEARRRKPGARS